MTDEKPPKPHVIFKPEDSFLGRVASTASSFATHPFSTTIIMPDTPEAARAAPFMFPGDTNAVWPPQAPQPQRPKRRQPRRPKQKTLQGPRPTQQPKKASKDIASVAPITVRVIPSGYKIAFGLVVFVTIAAFTFAGYLSLQNPLTEQARTMFENCLDIGKFGFGAVVGLFFGKSA